MGHALLKCVEVCKKALFLICCGVCIHEYFYYHDDAMIEK